MIKRFKNMRLRTQLTLIIVAAAMTGYALFTFLWDNRFFLWDEIHDTFHIPTLTANEEYFDMLYREAAKYELPESEDDTERIEKLEPYLALADDYTSLYVYGLRDGLIRAGKYASMMDDTILRKIFEAGYRITGGTGELVRSFPVDFKNETGLLMVYSYHDVFFLYPYAIFCLAVTAALFLFIVLLFISKKMKKVIKIKEHILRMSSGDLETPLPEFGGDEIGILSSELDNLRTALSETLRQEQTSRQANQDLITAMSHDLRTPLTLLNGYLEVLRLNKAPEKKDEYLNRCLQKTEDIKTMTDRMFEYALVFGETETPELMQIPPSFFYECLAENCDFIRLAGFVFDLQFPDFENTDPAGFVGDGTMLKRIFSNLFSNILKYGDKKETVHVDVHTVNKELKITIKNVIKTEHSDIESNHIGLKSTEKMMMLLGGRMLYAEKDNVFTVQLTFAGCSHTLSPQAPDE